MIKTCTVVENRNKIMLYDELYDHELLFNKARLSGYVNALWQPGDTITYAFMDGRKKLMVNVVNTFMIWAKYANINLKPVLLSENPQVRISFNQSGSWSYMGTECLSIHQSQPTVNFGWLTTDSKQDEINRVVLHEFGHVLGMIHEHQNPNGSIPWDKDAVYDMYSGPPNNWSRQEVDTNLFEVYDNDMTNSSEFDPKSIMLYPIPNQLTIGDYQVGWNTALSDMDKEWIAKIYY